MTWAKLLPLTGQVVAAVATAKEAKMTNPYTCHLPVTGPTPDANGWLPIESAPRDGTVFDVWVPSDDVGYRVADLRFSPAGRLLHGGNEAYLLRWPTHWQPLPPAPLGNGGE